MGKGRVPSNFYTIKRSENSVEKSDTLITKGKKQNKKSESDSVFRIKHGGIKFKFYREHLRDTIRYLKPYAGIKLIELEEESHQYLRSVLEANEKLSSHEYYSQLMRDDIDKEFSDVSPIIPGTVGAYLVGCSRPSNFDGPKACSPSCVNSINKCGQESCEQTMLFYKNGTFTAQNNKTTPDVYIFAEKENFKGFMPDNLARLQSNGVKTVSLILGDKNGSYDKIVKYHSVESLPKIDNNGLAPVPTQTPINPTNNGSSTSNTQTTTDDQNNTFWAILMVVIVVIIIAALLYLLYNNRKNK